MIVNIFQLPKLKSGFGVVEKIKTVRFDIAYNITTFKI